MSGRIIAVQMLMENVEASTFLITGSLFSIWPGITKCSGKAFTNSENDPMHTV